VAEPLPTRRVTYAEYLELELALGERLGFLDGRVWRPSEGPSVSVNYDADLGAVADTLLGTRWRVDTARPLVLVPGSRRAITVSACVISGESPSLLDEGGVAEPVALFSVPSPSTEGWDRGGKFAHAQQIPSLRHYVLISQETRDVEVFTRHEGGWLYTRHQSGAQVPLSALGVTLEVDDLYVDLPPVPEATS